MIDFTLAAYKQLLLTLKQVGYSFYTFEDWCDGKAHGQSVILRHDVDLKVANSLIIAGIEAELGIRATYYFRVVPQSNQPEIIKSIAGLGHEIGYHYEDLSLFHGDVEKSIDHFKTQLHYFRQFYPVRTICMHGSPTSKWDNRDIWKAYNYHDFGIVGEPYFDFLGVVPSNVNQKKSYFTDTARMWDGDKYNLRDKPTTGHKFTSANSDAINSKKVTGSTSKKNNLSECNRIHSTFDLIDCLQTKQSRNVIMITTHPQRWTDNYVDWFFEFMKQKVKNQIKKIIVSRK